MARSIREFWAGVASGVATAVTLGGAPVAYGQPVNLEHEGTLVIYAATDREAVQSLIEDFERMYVGLRVDYHDLNSVDLYQRFVAEAARGGHADVLWSSAMDLQVKLVNDGYAQPYRSLQTEALPGWAVWKDEAFGTTYEPVAVAYDKRRFAPGDVPSTHAELAQMLQANAERFRGRVTTYDPARSGVGLLLHSQDQQANPLVFHNISEALGRVRAVPSASVSAMLDAVVRGDADLAYNVLGSYALMRARSEPNLGVVLLGDYTLVMSRVAFIARSAPHPRAARLWMDYLLSPRGQQMLTKNAGFFSVRDDVAAPDARSQELRAQLGPSFRPITIGPSLLTYLDSMKRRAFLNQWRQATESH